MSQFRPDIFSPLHRHKHNNSIAVLVIHKNESEPGETSKFRYNLMVLAYLERFLVYIFLKLSG